MTIKMMSFVKWAIRVMKKGFWLLGLLPQIMDYIITFIPANDIPLPVKNFIDSGGSWSLTLILFAIGLVVSSFIVYKEVEEEKFNFQKQLDEIIDARPKIMIGLENETGQLAEKLVVKLRPIPSKPDFDKQVIDKKRQLLSKKLINDSSEGIGNLPDIFSALSAAMLEEPNPHYQEEVEEYLIEYRKYLVSRWEIDIDRAFSFYPIAINKGGAPASNIKIEFVMPREFVKPNQYQAINRSEIDDEFRSFLVHAPPEPLPNQKTLSSILASADFIAPPRVEPSIASQSPNNGPFYEEKNGIWIISYTKPNLVPHYTDQGFDPFWIWVGEIDKPVTWKISVRIYSSELRLPETCEIDLEFIFDDC